MDSMIARQVVGSPSRYARESLTAPLPEVQVVPPLDLGLIPHNNHQRSLSHPRPLAMKYSSLAHSLFLDRGSRSGVSRRKGSSQACHHGTSTERLCLSLSYQVVSFYSPLYWLKYSRINCIHSSSVRLSDFLRCQISLKGKPLHSGLQRFPTLCGVHPSFLDNCACVIPTCLITISTNVSRILLSSIKILLVYPLKFVFASKNTC